jgi:hypothetical protein
MSELAALAGAAVLYMVFAMWATQPPYTCAMVYEPHRQLNLDQEVDREHLARDGDEIGRMARRYARHIAASDSVVAQCEETLARGLMTTHEVTLAQVRTAVEAERAER